MWSYIPAVQHRCPVKYLSSFSFVHVCTSGRPDVRTSGPAAVRTFGCLHVGKLIFKVPSKHLKSSRLCIRCCCDSDLAGSASSPFKLHSEKSTWGCSAWHNSCRPIEVKMFLVTARTWRDNSGRLVFQCRKNSFTNVFNRKIQFLLVWHAFWRATAKRTSKSGSSSKLYTASAGNV